MTPRSMVAYAVAFMAIVWLSVMLSIAVGGLLG